MVFVTAYSEYGDEIREPDIGVVEDSLTCKTTSCPVINRYRRIVVPSFSGSAWFLLVLADPVSVYHLACRNIPKTLLSGQMMFATRRFSVFHSLQLHVYFLIDSHVVQL